MDNEIIEVTEQVNEIAECTALSNPKVKLAGKVGIGVGLAAGVGGLIALIVKKTKNLRLKWATNYLEKNGRVILDDSLLGDATEIDAEPVTLYSEDE